MDLATLGFAVDTSGLTQGGTALDTLTAKATQAATAAATVGTAAAQGGATAAQGLNQVANSATNAGNAAKAAGAAAASGFSLIPPAVQPASDAVDNLSNRSMFVLQRSLVELGNLASGGASPFTMLAMAGEHTALILGEDGGLSGVVEAIGKKFSFLASPATQAFTAIGGVVAGAGAALVAYAREQQEIQNGLAGIAGASGVTGQQIEAMADKVSNFGSISHGTAVELALDFAKVGTGADAIGAGVSLAEQMVGKLGVTSESAGKQVTDLFTDPQKAYEDLTSSLGHFNIEIDQQIKGLQASGDQMGAARLAMTALGQSLGGMQTQTSALTMAWHAFASAAIQDMQAFNSIFYGPLNVVAELGAKILGLRDTTQSASQGVDGFTAAQQRSMGATQAWAQTMIPGAQGLTLLEAHAIQAQNSIDALSAHIRQNGQASQAEVQALQQWQVALDAANGKIQSLVNADGSLVTVMQRVSQSTQASIQVMQAHGDAARAAAASNQAYVNAIQQGLGPEAAQAAAIAATDKAFAQATQSVTDWARQTQLGLDMAAVKLQTEIDLVGKSTTAHQQANAQLQLFDGLIQQLGTHTNATFPQMQEAWRLLTTDIQGANGYVTQTQTDFENLAQQMGLTKSASDALWNGFHSGISQAENDVNQLTKNLQAATQAQNEEAAAAAKALAVYNSIRGGGPGTPVNSADEGQPNTNWTPSPFTPASEGMAKGGAFTLGSSTVAFPVASGERIDISPGFADGGSFRMGAMHNVQHGPQPDGGPAPHSSFVVPGRRSRTDNTVVRLTAQAGDRVRITSADRVQHGFAGGGGFVVGFNDEHGTQITSTSPSHLAAGTGHESTAYHAPKLPKVPKAAAAPKAPKAPKAAKSHPFHFTANDTQPNLSAGEVIGRISHGYADGGSFAMGSGATVSFGAASGERIDISHGFAGGGAFDVGAGLSGTGGADPNGPYAGIKSFAGAGVSSGPGANTSGINAFGAGAAKAPDGVTSVPAVTSGQSFAPENSGGGSGDSLSSLSDALQLASFMSPSGPAAAVNAPAQTTQTNTAAGGGNNFYISVSITANDPTSFSNSSAQIASALRRAISSATSHMGP